MEMDLDPPERDKSERCCTLPELPQISEKAKAALSLLFTACLNIADCISDTWVVLRFGCVMQSKLTTSCDPDVGSEACEAHPAWFGIGLSLLVVSNSLQSACWLGGARSVLEDLDRLPETKLGWFATYLSLLVVAFFQMNYLVDIALVFKLGAPDDGRKDVFMFREFITKSCESAPQLYFQSYVLFAVGSHGDPAQLVSVCISVLALAHGMLKLGPVLDNDVQKPLENPFFYAVTFLWLASDQALRSAGFAPVLSQGSRPYGLALLALTSMAATGAFAAADAGYNCLSNLLLAAASALLARTWYR